MGARAFDKRPRLATTTSALDALEQGWWDANAVLVDRVWTLPPDVREAVRGPLAQRVREFFSRGTVLEVGCGTGWLGRMIAGDGLRIVGTDFSAEQLRIAEAEAGAAGLSDVCSYRQADFAELVGDGWDGVLIHASLHHLADDEVARVLRGLGESGVPKLFLYEPVFSPPVPVPDRVARLVARAVRMWLRRAWPSEEQYVFDAAAARELERLVAESDAAGWFFSPKEVPLDEQQVVAELRRYFDSVRSYPTHYWSMHVAQRIALVPDAAARARALERELARARRQDRVLFATRLYRLLTRDYVFYSFEAARSPRARP